jgi:hypothetical protein
MSQEACPMPLEIDTSHWPIRPLPLTIAWPTAAHPAYPHSFATKDEWLAFIGNFNLHPAIPLPTALKFARAQKLYAYAWLETDFVKAGELVALATLEGALRDCYGRSVVTLRIAKATKRLSHGCVIKTGERIKLQRMPMLAELMSYMALHDDLTDEVFAFSQRYASTVVGALFETDSARELRNEAAKRAVENPSRFAPDEPITLATIRNGLAHADAFEGWPWSGLLELIKDLIEYAYRERIDQYPVTVM